MVFCFGTNQKKFQALEFLPRLKSFLSRREKRTPDRRLLLNKNGLTFCSHSGPEFPLDFPEAIFVPIALIATLNRRNLDIRNEGVWGHGIFEFIRIFIRCLRQRILERNNATTLS